MCLLVFAWRPKHPQPLLVLANRDENHGRPTAPLAQWIGQPEIYAGRDLEAGGTWLGVSQNGRFATLTNIRDLTLPVGEQSRGALVTDFLASEQTPRVYLNKVASKADQYSGFNLLVADLESVWYLNSREARPVRLTDGIYALCNGSLDTPWPKLVRLRSAFSERLDASDQSLFELMQDEQRAADDQLPDTGVGLTMERMLSSIFIRGERYGTRATSLLRRFADGSTTLVERSYGVNGEFIGLQQIELAGLSKPRKTSYF
ncbi:NRDE family protein [Denitrificimonas sp. JX-1]|uniref:NRDE family protein n=1 Tax=Denitrificimonas halotolerans TaxID=3098930 RepID=A0ABU5GU14_9GAMM|nr:NRDE family protein [Denitrificimonas sp. JX-1]MDY7219992.1 NRDE family protein [Denitrificimonas sp. JX-1]